MNKFYWLFVSVRGGHRRFQVVADPTIDELKRAKLNGFKVLWDSATCPGKACSYGREMFKGIQSHRKPIRLVRS